MILKYDGIHILKNRKPEANVPRRGREIFQQKNTCDRFPFISARNYS